MGTTVNAAKIRTMHQRNAILCAREIVRSQHAGLSADEVELVFAQAQVDRDGVDWYPGRVAFEDHWRHGRGFVYWSLVAEGAGLAALADERFGSFCLVAADPQGSNPTALAVFPGNSVVLYSMAGNLDVVACRADATAWPERAELLTRKHAPDVPRTDDREWASMICTVDDFCEVVRAGDFPLTMLTEVRMDTALLERLEDLSARLNPLTPQEEAEVEAYETLDSWRRRHQLRIVGT